MITKTCKKFLSLLLAVTLVTGMLPMSVFAAAGSAWDGETLTEPEQNDNEVYQISNGEELAWFADKVNTSGESTVKLNAELINDIDLGDHDWTPIGSYEDEDNAVWYSGTFEGNGHVISNLHFENLKASCGGLFGATDGATIKNLGIHDFYIEADSNVGGIVGIAGGKSKTVIENCFVSNLDNDNGYLAANTTNAGGIVGTASNVTIESCYVMEVGVYASTDDVDCAAGGILSIVLPEDAENISISNCYVAASSWVIGYVAGGIFCGEGDFENVATNCYYLEGTVVVGENWDEYEDTESAVSEEDLKAMAETLGASFAEDEDNINNGFPM